MRIIKTNQFNDKYKLYYYINLDERGYFYADVRDKNDNSIFEINNIEQLNDMIRDGFMKNKYDIYGLEYYLKSIGIISDDFKIIKGNF